MFRQLVSFKKTNNVDVKAKGFWSLLSALIVIYHDAPLCIYRFCR